MAGTPGQSTRSVDEYARRVIAHPGEIDKSEIEDLKRRVVYLEGSVADLVQMIERHLRVAAQENDNITNRIRELELAS